MTKVTIDIPNPGDILDALTYCVRAVEGNRPDQIAGEATVTVRGFIDVLSAELIDAREREAFDEAWQAFAGNDVFDDDTEKNQQRNGFIEGWVRARAAEGFSSTLMTAEERRRKNEQEDI